MEAPVLERRDEFWPGRRVVYVGMPGEPIRYDVVAAQIKEARVEHIFRCAHVYPRTVAMLASSQIDVTPPDHRHLRLRRQQRSLRLRPRDAPDLGQGTDRAAAVAPWRVKRLDRVLPRVAAKRHLPALDERARQLTDLDVNEGRSWVKV
jgi:hypothetical protein